MILNPTAKKWLQILVGVAISAFFIWLSFRNIDLAELGRALKQTNWWYALPVMGVTMASFFWRCFRWQVLLAPVKKVTAARLYPPLMIGFAFNNIFPARAGEFARPLALAKAEGVPYGTGLSTVLLERVIDVITLLVLFIAMPYYMTIDPHVSLSYKLGGNEIVINAAKLKAASHSISILALAMIIILGSFLIPPVKRFYLWVLQAMPILPAIVKEKLAAFIESFTSGIQSVKSPRAVVLLAVHSLIIWFSVAFSFQLMGWGFPGVKITLGQSLAFLVVTCVIISIPSSPGFWGLYEFGGQTALVLMGVVENNPTGLALGFGFTAVVHFLQWLPITVYGLWAAGKLSVKAGDAVAAEKPA
ncbi:flippase-like domain-containing protein [Candidatus Sumerlaeota bacterium]|nr:flippase-like domain-containing protein [Candidatus Sumerlaeota bacterium]